MSNPPFLGDQNRLTLSALAYTASHIVLPLYFSLAL